MAKARKNTDAPKKTKKGGVNPRWNPNKTRGPHKRRPTTSTAPTTAVDPSPNARPAPVELPPATGAGTAQSKPPEPTDG